jgi:translation initiation factor IF-3
MEGLASVEAEPKVDGRNMVMVLAPSKSRARVVTARTDGLDDEAFDVMATVPAESDDDVTGASVSEAPAEDAPVEVAVDDTEEQVEA